ncbi:MAG: hypothetical protein ACODAD_11515 [Planctomycetota bacterium]
MKPSTLLVGVSMINLVSFPGFATAATPELLPGTGTHIDYVGDDFEDPQWKFIANSPKSSKTNDGRTRTPLGYSANRRWAEGPKRGYPDVLKVIPTPKGGLPESEHSLLMRTLHSGVPGGGSRQLEQDDLIIDCSSRLGTAIRPSELPNCIVRVYLPPREQWEDRSGPHFGIRMGLSTKRREEKQGLFGLRGGQLTTEPYWPGFWIHFRSETSPNVEADSAFLKVRADHRGRDFHVMELEEFGWWTFGMSITSDGAIHYYASPGVDELAAEHHITSQRPYSFRATQFRTFFFNICNRDGGSWSTPFVIDDPQVYVVKSNRVESIVQQKRTKKRTSTARRQRSSSRSRGR